MQGEDLFGTDVTEGWGDTTREAGEQSWAWIHVPARSSVEVIILSEAPVRYRGHWVDGRMRPCCGAACPYCERRMGGQVRYAFACYDLAARASALLEIGAGAAGVIREASEREGRLRGLAFRLRKQDGRDRGRIIIEPVAVAVRVADLPRGEDPSAHLLRGWGYRPGDMPLGLDTPLAPPAEQARGDARQRAEL